MLAGQVTGNIGVVYNMKGEPETALGYLNRALELMQAQEHQLAEAYWLVNIGGIHELRGEYDEAERKLTRALNIGRENGLREVTAGALGALAEVAGKRKDFHTAQELAQQALEIDAETGNLRGQATHMTQLMLVKREMGQLQEFEEGLKQVIALAEQVGDRYMVAERTGDLGVAQAERALKTADHELMNEAVIRLRGAIEGLDQMGVGRGRGARLALAECLAARGERDEAREVLERLAESKPEDDVEDRALLERMVALREKLAAGD